MALPKVIELKAGPDRRLTALLWLVWLGALVSSLLHLGKMPMLLWPVCAGLLLWSIPWPKASWLKVQRIDLYANGQASCGELQGRWHSQPWRSPWYTVVPIKLGNHKFRACISATQNSANDYRRLSIWCRYSPQEILTPMTKLLDS